MHVFSFSNRVFLRRGRGAYEAQANDFEHGGARLFLIIQVLYGLAKHRVVVHQSLPTDVWYLPLVLLFKQAPGRKNAAKFVKRSSRNGVRTSNPQIVKLWRLG